MKVSEAAVDHPRIILISVILISAMALLAAWGIPVQRTPAISTALVMVAVPYPGALPTETEAQITREIEDALQRLNDVDFIASTSMRGSSVTQVVFLDGVDPDKAKGDVKDLVDQVRSQLAGCLSRYRTDRHQNRFRERTPVAVNLSAPDGFDQRALKEMAEEVQEEIEAIPGVASTQLFGGLEREIHVDVNVDLASQYGLTLEDYRRALSTFHAELPGGQMDTGRFDYQVRNETKLRGVDDIRQAILKQEQGRLIRVGDVATVSDTHRRVKNVAQLDGQGCASIIVYKEADINTLGTSLAVKKRVAELTEQYPSLQFSTTRDTSDEISIMFRVLGSSFVFGAMLVLVILSWSMGLRISALVLTAIPLSTAVALIVLYATGVPLSNMVIFSFILVLGMVVDGAIIVAENIYRHVERGEDPVLAAKTGIQEVGMPVIIADLTTIAAYLPMLLVPGMMGDFMGVMPKVVSMALLGSMLVDHFLIPVMAARFFRQRSLEEADRKRAQRDPWLVRLYLTALNWALDQSLGDRHLYRAGHGLGRDHVAACGLYVLPRKRSRTV